MRMINMQLNIFKKLFFLISLQYNIVYFKENCFYEYSLNKAIKIVDFSVKSSRYCYIK